MLRGIFTAASGMISQKRKQEVLSHNLANINTPGFKQDNTVLRAFPELLIERIRDQKNTAAGIDIPSFPGQAPPIGRLNTGVYAQEMIPDFSQGDIVQTGNPLDVAIVAPDLQPQEVDGRQVKPAVFFAVRTAEGEVRYTRNGNWGVDALGHLVTSKGYLVLDSDGQPVELVDLNGNIAEEDFQIAKNGQVILHPNGDLINRLAIQRLGFVQFNNPHQLVREGNDVYRWEGDGPPPGFLALDQAQNFSLKQGFLERSNVDPTKTMAEMMSVVQLYEANQKVVKGYDQTLDKTVNSVGRVNG